MVLKNTRKNFLQYFYDNIELVTFKESSELYLQIELFFENVVSFPFQDFDFLLF